MNNLEKYNKIFVEIFEVKESDLTSEFTFDNVEKWDSLGHITLISQLEDTFEVMFDTEDIINFRSYENGKNILSKYGVSMKG